MSRCQKLNRNLLCLFICPFNIFFRFCHMLLHLKFFLLEMWGYIHKQLTSNLIDVILMLSLIFSFKKAIHILGIRQSLPWFLPYYSHLPPSGMGPTLLSHSQLQMCHLFTTIEPVGSGRMAPISVVH